MGGSEWMRTKRKERSCTQGDILLHQECQSEVEKGTEGTEFNKVWRRRPGQTGEPLSHRQVTPVI